MREGNVKCPRCRHAIRDYNLQAEWAYCHSCFQWLCRKHPMEPTVRCAIGNCGILCPLCSKVVGKGSSKVYACEMCVFKMAEKELST